jgi:hypothetical protein
MPFLCGSSAYVGGGTASDFSMDSLSYCWLALVGSYNHAITYAVAYYRKSFEGLHLGTDLCGGFASYTTYIIGDGLGALYGLLDSGLSTLIR